MSEVEADVDEDAVRDALEDAYRRKADSDVNKYELFGYANDLPTNTPDELALSIAGDVLRDPPALDDSGKNVNGDNFTTESAESGRSGWEKADFSTTTAGVYPPEHREYDAWMMYRLVDGRKQAYAPWGDENAPAECRKTGHTTAAECGCDARWKWGHEPNRNSFEKAKMSLPDDRFEGLAYIQTEADPFVFVDGDDVRDPDTGDVHPAFVAFLEHFGLTYADVSTSGTGVHAYYRGTLPEDETMATWQIDDEPFGANDDLPAIELYSGKHVCVTTGEHVTGTPTEVRRWDGAVLRPLLEANDEFTQTITTTDRQGSDSGSSGAKSADDPIDAVEALDAADVAEKTIVDKWTSGGGAGETFLPTWGSSDDGGTANFVDETCWVDTGKNGGSGGPIEMAMIDLGKLRNDEAEVGCVDGAEFWTAYEHLRDLNFDLPEPPSADAADEPKSAYYDADLGAYVDGDPWSDPDAMLTACLMARAEGAVDRDAEPPKLALVPIVREYLGIDDVDAETQEAAEKVYLNELSRSANVDGDELDL